MRGSPHKDRGMYEHLCVFVSVCGGADPRELKAGSETEGSAELRARGTEEGTHTL